jgi:hypothetical protein
MIISIQFVVSESHLTSDMKAIFLDLQSKPVFLFSYVLRNSDNSSLLQSSENMFLTIILASFQKMLNNIGILSSMPPQ